MSIKSIYLYIYIDSIHSLCHHYSLYSVIVISKCRIIDGIIRIIYLSLIIILNNP
eukprot:COSAG06_NODE_3075_length_5891_cov_2.111188_9_plen_55_part_00